MQNELANETIYFDDLAQGDIFAFGPYRVTREEMLEFSRKWDPLPMHIDEESARARGYRATTASGQYTLCVKQALMTQAPWRVALIGAMGFDKLRFPRPVYAGDDLKLTIECVDTQPSRSKPDRGIVKFTFEVANQDDETVLSYLNTVMFAKRNGSAVADSNPVPSAPAVPESQALALASTLMTMKRNGVEPCERIAHIVKQLRVESEVAERVHMDFEAGLAVGAKLALGMPPSKRHEPTDEGFHAIATQLGARDMQSMMDEEQARKAQRKRRGTVLAVCICIAGAALFATLFLM